MRARIDTNLEINKLETSWSVDDVHVLKQEFKVENILKVEAEYNGIDDFTKLEFEMNDEKVETTLNEKRMIQIWTNRGELSFIQP